MRLLPAPAYPFPDSTVNSAGTGMTIIRGCLISAAGAPRTGVPVSVAIQEPGWTLPAGWPLAESLTNDNGEWVLVLPDQQEMIDPPPSPLRTSINVRYTLDGATFDDQVAAGRERRFLQASLRGAAADARGRALPGVTVTNSLQAGSSITGRDGRWSIFFPFGQTDAPCTVQATAPDGRVLSRQADVVAHKAVLVERFQFA
jgi:hypothetical protein